MSLEEPLVLGEPKPAPRPRLKFLGHELRDFTPLIFTIAFVPLVFAAYWFVRLVPWAPRTLEGQVYVATLGVSLLIAIAVRVLDHARSAHEPARFEFRSDSIHVTHVEGQPSNEVPWPSLLSYDDREDSTIALATRLEDPRLANLIVPTPGKARDELLRLLEAQGVPRSEAGAFRIASAEDSAA